MTTRDKNSHDEDKKHVKKADKNSDNVIELKTETEKPSVENEKDEKIAQLANDLKELNNKYLRAMADAENSRRRLEKEKSDIQQYGNERLVQNILPVLDSFEKAFKDASLNEDEAMQNLYKGFQLVAEQLYSTLEKQGLKRIEAKDQPFNPNLHQAIHKTDDDEIEIDTVGDEFAAGYTLNGKLIRPAMVSVKTPTAKE